MACEHFAWKNGACMEATGMKPEQEHDMTRRALRPCLRLTPLHGVSSFFDTAHAHTDSSMATCPAFSIKVILIFVHPNM